MFSQDMLGKTLGVRARAYNPKSISPPMLLKQFTVLHCTSEPTDLYVHVRCVCVRKRRAYSAGRFTDGRQHRRMNPAVVLLQNVITEGGKVRLQG